MSQTAKSYNTNGVAGGWNVTIPDNAINISFYMRGGRGGSGGADASDSGGGTGDGGDSGSDSGGPPINEMRPTIRVPNDYGSIGHV